MPKTRKITGTVYPNGASSLCVPLTIETTLDSRRMIMDNFYHILKTLSLFQEEGISITQDARLDFTITVIYSEPKKTQEKSGQT